MWKHTEGFPWKSNSGIWLQLLGVNKDIYVLTNSFILL